MPSVTDRPVDVLVDETTSLLDNGFNTDDDVDSTIPKDENFQPKSVRKSSISSIKKEDEDLSIWTIGCILSTSFAYGCIMTTLFLITLPVECQRIEDENPNVPKSVALGCFVAIAGVTQLVSPLIGMLSDTYRPPLQFQLGQRLPYLALGSICSVCGLFGEYIYSYEKLWLRYGFFFFWHMIGLNMTYAMMIALIPDQVPHSQTGVANGILALELVTGSLTGFGLFHFYFGGHVQDMYGLYICIVVITTIMTSMYAHDGDAGRMELIYSRRQSIHEFTRRQRTRQVILGPFALAKTMLWDPIRVLDRKTIVAAYTIDTQSQHDFFVVTVSRLCYYCGSSVQTFFLYFLHDIIRVSDNTESAVALLAVASQISGALFCYPVGFVSDRFCDGRRKPFVYTACVLLGSVTFSMIFARTMNQMSILCFILGAANGSYLTMETSLAIDTLPEEYDDGPSGGHAQLLGVWGVAAFLGSALGPMVGGPLLYLVGSYGPLQENQDYSIYGYAVVLSLSTAYFLMSAISLKWVRKLGV
ncbi:major facilitator superfamily transporter [Nitzschia inconspicua]|uniref:Major facilitator superfamily transporter n=1 Tax=Nitzschia inconspicua TaxID=303405 RepID=A0A9K3KWP3_9STRA|nr:major facilitator superfamily transporter [Nitzschia inconspicua]